MPDIDHKDPIGESDNQFINGDWRYTPLPERHGCVTAWLKFGLILNCLAVIMYLFLIGHPLKIIKLSPPMLMGYLIITGLAILCYIKMLSYKKNGFYGVILIALIAYVLNLYAGLGFVWSTLSLGGIGLLYAVLQIKRNGISAWKYFK